MNDYKSLRKKNGARTIAIIMALLVILEMCSLAVLFSQVVSYSAGSDRYVISLIDGAEHTKAAKIDTSKTGFIVPTTVVDPDTLIEASDSVNTLDFGFQTKDTDQVWTTDTPIEFFHMSYDETGEVTVQSMGGDKVFAPGTGSTYGFTLKNTGSYNLDYLVYVEAYIDAKDAGGNDLSIPLEARFYRGDGSYIVGSAENTVDYLDLHESGDLGSVGAGEKQDYFIEWLWPYERYDGEGLAANDAYDTMLGNLAASGSELKASIKIKTVAWWEDYWKATADVKSGEGTASVTPEKVVQFSDDTFSFTAVPDTGYEFVGWEFDEGDDYEIVSGTLSSATLVVKPGSDLHAHAVFKPIETQPQVDYWFAVADVKSGDGIATVDPAKVVQGSEDTFTLVATPGEGYEFVGWEFDDGDVYDIISGSASSTTLVVKPGSDIHAHAVFKPIPTQPPVQFWSAFADVKSGQGTADVSPAKVVQGSEDTFTFTATPADGYEFVGWEFDDGDVYDIVSGSASSTTLVVKPGSDIHAHAVFKALPTQPPVIEYWNASADVKSGQGTANVTPSKVEKGSGDTFEFTAIPAEGYEFDHWEFDNGDIYDVISGSTSTMTLVVNPGSDVHAHAVFKPVQPQPVDYTAEAKVVSGEGTAKVNPSSVVAGSGDTFTFEAVPVDGYEFAGWEFEGSYTITVGDLNSPKVVLVPGSNIVGKAKFVPKSTEPPTTEPTTQPTEGPSDEPTTEPTVEPTTIPTEAPTTAPVPPQPRTGDSTNVLLWLIIAVAAFVALIVLFFVYRRAKKTEKAGRKADE